MAKTKIKRKQWLIAGLQAGWYPLVSRTNYSFSQLKKTAHNDASEIDLEQGIKNAVDTDNYETAYVLRENDEILDKSNAHDKIVEAFLKLAEKKEDFKNTLVAHIKANKPFQLSTYMRDERGRKIMVPTFNTMGLTEYTYEFSSSVKAEPDYPPEVEAPKYPESELKPVDSINDIGLMTNAAGIIARYGVLRIGSIGSRVTNWDSSYEFILKGMERSSLTEVLTWFTDITNEDIRNYTGGDETQQFTLTQAKEIYGLMDRLGVSEIFHQARNEIKMHEKQKGLKQKYQRNHKITNRELTKIVEVNLSEHATDIQNSIIQKILNNPHYNRWMSQIEQAEDKLQLFFSIGFEGEKIDEQDVQNIVQLDQANVNN